MAETKMWGGRFQQATQELVENYTESVSYDHCLYLHDIAGSTAHANMLAKQGILTAAEAEQISLGLATVKQEIESGAFKWQQKFEDVHMNIESRLTELIGDTGKKLHTGRSRNDQVALDFRLFVSDRLRAWHLLAQNLCSAFLEQAQKHRNTLLPGYTHMQPAQPISLPQHLLAYVWMLKRDCERMADCDKRTRISPLGAAALAGTSYPIDPASVAAALNMFGTFKNSMDAVSDRDFAAEAMFCASLTMTHLSRFCEDIIIWANPMFGFVNLPDAYATGSSIMPQKKNPDVAELMRGKTGRVYGSLFSLLTTLKGLPMTYNRDLQEDKQPFFDLDRTITMSLQVMAGMVGELDFNADKMKAALKKGFLNATELADYLVGKGIPFREAHHLTGAAVALAERKNITLEELDLSALQEISQAIQEDVYNILSPEAAVTRRNSPGGTGPESVATQLKELSTWLQK